MIVWLNLILDLKLFILFELVFEDAFERDDLEDDPEALEDPLMKIDLLVNFSLKII